MDTVSLREAWTSWLSGQNVSNMMLWGLQILWWGRLGKIVTFLSGVTIIAEILGPDRLKAFGDSLRKLFEFNRSREYLLYGLRWFRLELKLYWYMSNDDFPNIKRIAAERQELKAGKPRLFNFFGLINFVIVFVLTAILFIRDLDSTTSWGLLLVAALLFFGWGILIFGPILTFILVALIQILLTGMDMLLIEPFAWVLSRSDLNTLVRIASLSLLMLGFYFDLLAS